MGGFKRTAVTVVGVHAWLTAFGDFELVLGDDLVQSEGSAAEEFASVAMAGDH